MSKYYNGDNFLKTLDLDKEKPSFFIVTSNRSAGKTTYFLKHSMERFRKYKEQTVLLYRYNYELSGASSLIEGFMQLFPDLSGTVTLKAEAKGMFYRILIDNETFGFSIALYNPDPIKKFSFLFADVKYVILDEYQKEDGKYLNKEVEKFLSIIMSIARGGGKQIRYIQTYLLGNLISIMNPYFIYWGIHKRIKANTKVIRGHGWICQLDFNKAAHNALEDTAIYRAFKGDKYIESNSAQNVFLYDSKVFIKKPQGKSKYICTIKYDNMYLGVREFWEDGVVYVSKQVDKSYKYVVSFKASDHNQNTIMLSHYSNLWKNIKDAFQNGYLRFDDEKSKMAIYDILAIDMYK